MAAAKLWCYTFQNYGPADIAALSNRLLEDHFEEFVAQSETADSGTKHIQGYLKLRTKLRLQNLQQLLGELLSAEWRTVHLEKCRSRTHAIEYCRKNESFNGEFRHEFGVPPNGEFSSLFAMPQDDPSVYFWMDQMFKGYNWMCVRYGTDK